MTLLKNPNYFVLFGGPSSERKVSFGTRDYFCELYAYLNPRVIEWREDFSFTLDQKDYSEKELLNFLKRNNAVIIIASHGEYVEDGYIQEKFQDNHIRFTGSNAIACRLSMNKYASAKAVENFALTIPTYKTLPSKFSVQELSTTFPERYPLFIKPNNLGSSIGTYKIYSREDLLKRLQTLSNLEYLFQPALEGVEVSLGTVRRNTGFVKLYPTEIIPKSEFFDYAAKYKAGGSEEITPAQIGKNLTTKLQKLANRIHNTLGLGYYSRSDFIIAPDKRIYYLETNSLPGMTKTSLIPQQLAYVDKVEEFRNGLIAKVVEP
jgi:D-alanine-D-alanine ligase